MERVAKLGDVDVAPLKLTFFPGLCESFYRSMKVINAGVCVCENWYNLCYLLSLFSRHFRVWMWQERGWKSVFWWLLSADIQEAKYSIQYFHTWPKQEFTISPHVIYYQFWFENVKSWLQKKSRILSDEIVVQLSRPTIIAKWSSNIVQK